jgi:adenylate cyclase
MAVNQLKLEALLRWLAAGAPPQSDYGATVAELGRRMVDLGIQLDFIAIYQIPLNPLLGGLRYTWEPRSGTRVREHPHAEMTSDLFIGGVVHAALTTDRTTRYPVGKTPRFDEHPGSERIIAGGHKEFIVFPFQFTGRYTGCFAVAAQDVDRLPDDQFDACRRLMAPLARVVQSEIQRQSGDALLRTYLGKDASTRVSAGKVKRGDAEMIRAVILFTDLIGFTELSNRLAIEATVGLLNRYFEALEVPIITNGGEVLKLMGDGLLAVFPTSDDLTSEEGAALSALSAVADARAALAGSDIAFRAAFHVGEIHYGNIGGLSRLDFTAIGPSVNLASRLLDAAARAKVQATCSAAFARLAPDATREIGTFDLKGFDAPQLIFDAS